MVAPLTPRDVLTVAEYEIGSLFVAAYPGSMSLYLKVGDNQWLDLWKHGHGGIATDYGMASTMKNFTAATYAWWVY